MRYLIVLLIILVFTGCSGRKSENLIKYVDTMIGTDAANTISALSKGGSKVDFGQTIPAVTAPFGMTQWTLQTRKTEKKCIAPFYFNEEFLQGFRATHWTSGSCVQDYGSFTIMPISQEFRYLPEQRKTRYYFESGSCSPAYYIVHFPDYNVIAEMTATKRCGFFRFSWFNPVNPMIIIDINSDEGQGYIKIDTAKNEICGYNPVHRIYNGSGKPAGFSGYFVAQFSKPFTKSGTFSGPEFSNEKKELVNLPDLGAYTGIDLKDDGVLKVKIGTSFTSFENARKNLESEIPGWDFNKIRSNLDATWNKLLEGIKVEGGTDDDLKKFYTALYHSCIHPRLVSDVDGSYPGFAQDSAIHVADGFGYYDDFSNWDIFRAQMPLLSLVAPENYKDMVNSLIIKAEQGGWLPIFPMWNSYTAAMIGDHSVAVIGDAIMKGFQVDTANGYKYMRKNAFESPGNLNDYIDGKGRRALKSYLQFGYIPLEDQVEYAFHRREQVSRTLEYAYDDWVLAQVAKKLGHNDDYQMLSARAQNYVNVYDPQKGWVCGRFADGRFTGEFDANGKMPYITEGTPKHYTWFVPQDVPGLVSLMGGKENFTSKLSSFIDNKEYWHGNEPSHHIPYLFNYVGKWGKTQETVKNILATEYGNDPGGLSGNDDAGQMSAWYVYSAMGFYPVCPGSNEYQLSSPVFRKITLRLDKRYYPGGKFTIFAESQKNNLVFTKVRLNGKEIKPVIHHEDLKKGGKLEFGL